MGNMFCSAPTGANMRLSLDANVKRSYSRALQNSVQLTHTRQNLENLQLAVGQHVPWMDDEVGGVSPPFPAVVVRLRSCLSSFSASVLRQVPDECLIALNALTEAITCMQTGAPQCPRHHHSRTRPVTFPV